MVEKFILSYSNNAEERTEQIWSNLQDGIVFEDKGFLLPWSTSYQEIDKYKEKRIDSGDRIEWYFGKRKILNGLECHLTTLKWSFQPFTSSFDQVEEFLGFDEEGFSIFLEYEKHITDLLKAPLFKKTEKFGNVDVGSIVWEKGLVRVTLSAWERFAVHYKLSIGLINNSHDKDLYNSNSTIAKRMKTVIGFMKKNS